MLSPGPATRIYLARDPADMRKSYNGLFALVGSQLRQDPLSGHLFIFGNRRRDRLKILFWDGSGFWIHAKRLEKGTFYWPGGSEQTVEMSHAQLALLLGGIDLAQTRARRWIKIKKSA